MSPVDVNFRGVLPEGIGFHLPILFEGPVVLGRYVLLRFLGATLFMEWRYPALFVEVAGISDELPVGLYGNKASR